MEPDRGRNMEECTQCATNISLHALWTTLYTMRKGELSLVKLVALGKLKLAGSPHHKQQKGFYWNNGKKTDLKRSSKYNFWAVAIADQE